MGFVKLWMVIDVELYYQNETLFVDIDTTLDIENMEGLKNKIFRIIDDYGIDNIVLKNNTHQLVNTYYLRKLKQEYRNKYQGRINIKWLNVVYSGQQSGQQTGQQSGQQTTKDNAYIQFHCDKCYNN